MLHRLEAKNTVFFKYGLEVDEVIIDFRKFKNQIVVIEGGVGLGKSSLLELCMPFRKLPTRDIKKASGYFVDGVGHIKKIWEIDGIIYEFIIKSTKTKCYYFINILTEDYQSKKALLNTSLQSDYDEMIEKICGPQEIFLHTLYRSRDITFSGLSNTDTKSFFLKLINAEIYELARKKILEDKSMLIKEVEHISNEILAVDWGLYELRLNNLELAKEKLISLNLEIENLEKYKDDLIKLDKTSSIEQVKLDSLKTEYHKFILTQKEQTSNLENLEKYHTELLQDISELSKTIDYINNRNVILKDIEQKISIIKNYKIKQDILLKNSTDLKLLNNKLHFEQKLLTAFELEKSKCETNIADAENEFQKAKNDACKVDIALCNNSFLITNAENRLLTLKEEYNTKFHTEADLEIKDRIQKIQEDISNLEISNEIDLETQLMDIVNTFKTLEDLSDLEKEKEEIKTSSKLLYTKHELITKTKLKEVELVKELEQQKEKLTSINETILQLETSIKELEVTSLAYENDLLDKTNEDITNARIEKEKLNETIITLTKLISETDFIIKQNSEKEKQIKTKLELIEDHELAEVICGKKSGIPVLKLKKASKNLEEKTNSLLKKFPIGDEIFQVKIETETKNSSGTEIDTFNFKATRNGKNEIDLNLLSSGQKIIIETALSLSANAYIANKFKVLLFDETDGSLSPEEAPVYFKTIDAYRKDSGINLVLYISHSQVIHQLANKKIVLQKGLGIY